MHRPSTGTGAQLQALKYDAQVFVVSCSAHKLLCLTSTCCSLICSRLPQHAHALPACCHPTRSARLAGTSLTVSQQRCSWVQAVAAPSWFHALPLACVPHRCLFCRHCPSGFQSQYRSARHANATEEDCIDVVVAVLKFGGRWSCV